MTATTTAWNVQYEDVEPIRIRDPVAEALAVREPGEPFVITYRDVVAAAGHSCPTAAGAYRIAQFGLDALYPDGLPVRGDVRVEAGGPRDAAPYGVMSRLLTYVTGAAGADGFGGLAGGYGDRRNLLSFADEPATDGAGGDVTFTVERVDTGAAVDVTYHVGALAEGRPAVRVLKPVGRALDALGVRQSVEDALVGALASDGSGLSGAALAPLRAAFARAWHANVERVLTDDALFTVTASDAKTEERETGGQRSFSAR